MARPHAKEDCVICFDVLPSWGAEADPCGHRTYHTHCLLQWLELNPTCPLCKAAVHCVRYGPKRLPIHTTRPKPLPSPSSQESTTSSSSSSPTTRSLPPPTTSLRRRRRRRPPIFTDTPRPLTAYPTHRLDIYRLGRFSLHVGSNKHSGYGPSITRHSLTHDPDLQSRARAFIRRELLVLDALEDSPRRDVLRAASPPPRARARADKLEYIMCVLRSAEMQAASGVAEVLVGRHLGEHTALFLHELRAFLRSPFRRLEEWDEVVQYGPPTREAVVRAGG